MGPMGLIRPIGPIGPIGPICLQGPLVPAIARLTMAGIHKSFGPTLALRGVDLELRPGEVHALIGENGAGKSTLMKVLSGAELPDAGNMTLDGIPYHPASPLDAR